MSALVTGAAGFIGSHLVEALLERGTFVRGVDCFTDTYDHEIKRRNLMGISSDSAFEFTEGDIRSCDLEPLLDGVGSVFHHAAIPGVRASWGVGSFKDYVQHNVLGTHRLLEACRNKSLHRFVYASSSSVYGHAPRFPTSERDLATPHSPYGVSKLAGEHLCTTYANNFGLPAISLRYFTVYGPRQRPDMAIHRIIEAAMGGAVFSIYGTGDQVRDFTYVGDVVRANLAANDSELHPGVVINVAGGDSASLNEVIKMVGNLAGVEVPVRLDEERAGDVQRTGGAIELARDLMDWTPEVDLAEGLTRQIDWAQTRI